jgi:hypothetical protein
MSRPDWGELSRKLGPQLPPLRPGELAPAPAPWPACDRCGKRRTVGLVRGATLYCIVCAGLLRDAGLLDEVVGDGEDAS